MIEINQALASRIEDAKSLLKEIDEQYSSVTFASSFGAEDMVLTDLICKFAPNIEIFSLDTGRLPKETYALMQEVLSFYDKKTQVYAPSTVELENFIRQNGPNAFYDSVELRQTCCAIRKVEPLKRALAGKKAWITGLRRSQSVTRADLPLTEWDEDHGLQKFSPLKDWSNGQVWKYIRAFDVPYNKLHDEGYASIGCAPCTRPIAVGEDIRAGRWWWENPESKECGLHVKSK